MEEHRSTLANLPFFGEMADQAENEYPEDPEVQIRLDRLTVLFGIIALIMWFSYALS